MAANIITTEEFNSFKSKIFNELNELKKILKKENLHAKWLKSSEVKELLKISHGTLQNLRNNGSITYSKIGGSLFYKYEDVERLLEENSIK